MSPLRRSNTSLFYLMLRRLMPLWGPVACLVLCLVAGACVSPDSSSVPKVAPESKGARELAGHCPAAREYIATDKFLAGQKAYQLDAKERESVAERVSSGCKGSAQRFASTVRLLVASGLGLNNAIDTGIELARSDDRTASGFRQVFSRCFLKEHLDLDLLNCLKVAKWLSLTGDSGIQPENFVKVVRYCTQKAELRLSHSRCAKLAIRLAKVPFNGPSYSAADKFQQLFGFLISKNGPALGSVKAMKLAAFLASHSPSSADNYQVAYSFAKRSKDARRAHSFALALAKKLPAQPTAIGE